MLYFLKMNIHFFFVQHDVKLEPRPRVRPALFALPWLASFRAGIQWGWSSDVSVVCQARCDN